MFVGPFMNFIVSKLRTEILPYTCKDSVANLKIVVFFPG